MKLICKEECSIRDDLFKGNIWTVFSSLLVLFMPKCAICWAAYLSVLSALGITIKYQPWFTTLAIALFVVTLIKLLYASIRRKNFLAFSLAVTGGMVIFMQRSVVGMDTVKMAGVLILTASVLMDKIIALVNLLKKKQAKDHYIIQGRHYRR